LGCHALPKRASETSCEIRSPAPWGVPKAFFGEMYIDVHDFSMVEPDYTVTLPFADAFGCSSDGG
jgi:hypothetical protein